MGIDAHVEPCLPIGDSNKCNPTGRLLGLQIKAGPSWFAEAVTGGWYHRISDAHYRYWTQHTLPVLVVLWNIEHQCGYWAHVQAGAIQSTGLGWKLLVPATQLLEASVSDVWWEIAGAAQPSPQVFQRLVTPWTVPFRRNHFFTGPGTRAWPIGRVAPKWRRRRSNGRTRGNWQDANSGGVCLSFPSLVRSNSLVSRGNTGGIALGVPRRGACTWTARWGRRRFTGRRSSGAWLASAKRQLACRFR